MLHGPGSEVTGPYEPYTSTNGGFTANMHVFPPGATPRPTKIRIPIVLSGASGLVEFLLLGHNMGCDHMGDYRMYMSAVLQTPIDNWRGRRARCTYKSSTPLGGPFPQKCTFTCDCTPVCEAVELQRHLMSAGSEWKIYTITARMYAIANRGMILKIMGGYGWGISIIISIGSKLYTCTSLNQICIPMDHSLYIM